MIELDEMFLRATIPVVVNSFNQLTYLKNMMRSLRRHGFRSIVILDHASDYPPLVKYLGAMHAANNGVTVIMLPENFGPHWFFGRKVFRFVPSPMIFTDPDIQLPDRLDDQFCLRLLEATHRYKVPKAGVALDISTPEFFKNVAYVMDGKVYRIHEWEQQFWENEVEPQVYRAGIDTTFHLFNATYFTGSFFDAVRFAGPGFLGRHLPWYEEEKVPLEEVQYYRERSTFSTWAELS